MNSCIPRWDHSVDGCLAVVTGTAAEISQSSEHRLRQVGQSIPVDFGVKTAADAAFGEIPRAFAGCTLFVTGDRGLNDGESTFRKRLALYSHEFLGSRNQCCSTHLSACWLGFGGNSWL
jgi:hypothetical protein